MQHEDLPSLVIEVARAAVARGFPVYAKRLGRGNVLVELPGGRRAVYRVHPVIDPFSGSIVGVGLAPTWDYGGVRVAVLAGDGGLVPLLPDFVLAIAQYQHMMRGHEVDVWRLRLQGYERISRAHTVPEPLQPLVDSGLEAGFLGDTCDYTIMRGRLVALWFNECTGRIDPVFEWQERMGVYDWSGYREVLQGWLREHSG